MISTLARALRAEIGNKTWTKQIIIMQRPDEGAYGARPFHTGQRRDKVDV